MLIPGRDTLPRPQRGAPMSEALKMLGEFETDREYAERFAALARELGAFRAFVV